MKNLRLFASMAVVTLLLAMSFAIITTFYLFALYIVAFLILGRFVPLNINVAPVIFILFGSMLLGAVKHYCIYDVGLPYFVEEKDYNYGYWQLIDVGSSIVNAALFYCTSRLLFFRPFLLNHYLRSKSYVITPADPFLIRMFGFYLVLFEFICIAALIFNMAGVGIWVSDAMLIYIMPQIKNIMLSFCLVYVFAELKDGGGGVHQFRI